jgi:1-acyl-sn-glycerol-3-phosphate acyltransferase
MLALVSKFILKILGWNIINEVNLPNKAIIIGAPHTSNWDFLIARCYTYATKIKAKYLIKSELFYPILGSLIKMNGGVPVYRDSKNKLVNQVVDRFSEEENFIIAMFPEGTRKKVDKWKTGFYYIALNANIPVCLFKMDYVTKEIGFFNSINLKGDFKQEMQFIEDQYKNHQGKILANYNPKIF